MGAKSVQVTERAYSPRKINTLQRIMELSKSSRTVGLVRLQKIRAQQLAALRKLLRGEVTLVAVRNKLASMALTRSGIHGGELLASKLNVQSALIFTNLDPFKLYLILERNKVNLPARAGDHATEDIIITAGNTGLPPGPIISDFKEAGVPTKIDTGSIWVTKDTVAVRSAQQITPRVAGLLSKLGLKPIIAGLSLSAAWHEDLVLGEEDLRIDLDQWKRSIQEAYQSSINLAVKAGYVTKETLPSIVALARVQALSLASQSGYLTADTIALLLVGHEQWARQIYNLLRAKGYY